MCAVRQHNDDYHPGPHADFAHAPDPAVGAHAFAAAVAAVAPLAAMLTDTGAFAALGNPKKGQVHA